MSKTIDRRAAAAATGPGSDLRNVLRLLVQYLTGHRSLFALALVLLIVEAVTAVFEAYPLAYLIDFLRGSRPSLMAFLGLQTVVSPLIDTVALLTGAIVVLAMVNSLADSLAEIMLAKGGRLLGYNLRTALYAHLQRLSLRFHDQRRTGDVLTRVTGDVAAVEDFVIGSLSDIVGSLLVLVGTLVFLFYNSWHVAVVAVLIVPLLAVVSNHYSQQIKATARKQRARDGDLASSAQEMLISIRVVQAFSRAGYEQARFAKHSQLSMEAALETAGLQARFSWVVKVLEALAIAVVVWVGLWLIQRNAITVGTLVYFIILVQNMFKPTRKIIKEWNRIGKIYASVERIGEVLDVQPAVQDAPDAIPAPPFRGEVAFRRVTFSYHGDGAAAKAGSDQQHVLRDISFTIVPGEVCALVGHTGAGKSTIAQLLPRLYDVQSGQILIDGQDIRRYTLNSLRAQLSFVLQETILFSGSVADNIAYGRDDATIEEVITAAKLSNAHEFIEKLPEGYNTLLGERGVNLSGGQRQRIAIARAFIRNAPVLVLDEPTTGLDAASTKLVLQALRTLMQGKTTILISHDFGLIRQADKIVVLQDGAIVEQGDHAALLAAGGVYAGLCRDQLDQLGDVPIAEPAAVAPAQTAMLPDHASEQEASSAAPEPITETKVAPRESMRVRRISKRRRAVAAVALGIASTAALVAAWLPTGRAEVNSSSAPVPPAKEEATLVDVDLSRSTEVPSATPTAAVLVPTSPPSPTPTLAAPFPAHAAELEQLIAEAEASLQTGWFDAELRYGDGTRTLATVRFDLGDGQREARFHATTTYSSSQEMQVVETLSVGDRTWRREPDGEWQAAAYHEGPWGQLQGYLPQAARAVAPRAVGGTTMVELHWSNPEQGTTTRVRVDRQTRAIRELRRSVPSTQQSLTVTYYGWNTPVTIDLPPDLSDAK